MKITKITLGEVNIPLVTPFKTALRTVDHVNDIVVRIDTDSGEAGFGEAPPTAVITGDTKGSIVCAVRDFIAPTILGMDMEQLEEIMQRMHSCIVKNTSAKAAVDMALYDLYAKSKGLPLYKALGGTRREVETDLTISVNDTPEMVRDSLRAVEQGFRVLKIKVGKLDPAGTSGFPGAKDVERIKAIRQAVGPSVILRVDANQGWDTESSIRIIHALEDADLNIDLVEQPVNAHDFKGLKQVTASVSTPILADESVFSPEDALHIIQEKAADLINIKLMKTGGIHEALKICGIAEQFGVECMVGCMLESKIAVSAAAHLAAASDIITRADLDGPSLCSMDPYEGGPLYQGPLIIMQEAPGIGITRVPAVFS